MSTAAESHRRDEVAAALAAVEARITAACTAAHRDRSDLTLIAVTKTYPAADARLLGDFGVRDLGENRHPEAGRKADEVGPGPTWHFLGGLQTNKAAAVARYADVVHSVDRDRLVAALSRGAEAAGREVGCLVQIDFGPMFGQASDGRSGTEPKNVADLAAQIAAAPGLRFDGVMTVAPLGVDPAPVFEALVRCSTELRATYPAAGLISAGMSNDLEAAVAAGATHLRVGRAILGERPPLR